MPRGRPLTGAGAGRGPAGACALAGVLTVATLLWFGSPEAGGELLRGPDDHMRLVQVRDWLDGQGWSDLVQHRLDPPAGVAMHWSRLGDLPLAAAALAAETRVGRARALDWSARVVPPLLGGAMVAAFVWAIGPLARGRPGRSTVLVSGALFAAFPQFVPGRIDHHGLQLVLLVCLCGCLARAATGRVGPAAGAGAVGAVSLAVGLETLPAVLVAGAVLAGAAVARPDGARPYAAFGAALALAAAALWATAVPAAERWAAACDRLSWAHAAGAWAVAAGGAALVLRGGGRPAGPASRALALGGVTAAGLAAVAAAAPQCVGGPYADLAPEVRYWFERVTEARSLPGFFHAEPVEAVLLALFPAAAAAAAVARFAAEGRRDWQTAGLAALALAGAALLVWQIRAAYQAWVVGAFALAPLAAAADERVDAVRLMAARVALRLALPAACAATVAVAAAVGARDDAAGPPGRRCDLRAVLPALSDATGLGAAAQTVAAPIDLGPAILLETRHRVLAAPYHRNARGLADNRLVFAGTEAEARATLASRGVGVVVFCRRYARWTDFDDRQPFLDERLAARRPPPWLAPVAERDGIAVFRVDRGTSDAGNGAWAGRAE